MAVGRRPKFLSLSFGPLRILMTWQQVSPETVMEGEAGRREGEGIPLLAPGFSLKLLSKVSQVSMLIVK